MRKFITYLNNALTVIEEINKGGIWKPESFHGGVLYSISRSRDGKYREIWVANDSWFCDSKRDKDGSYFGLICRHIAWWGAIYWYKRSLEY